MKKIPRLEYAKITKVLPILCIDVILTDEKGRFLLVKRENEPKRNKWWLVGGRVLKGESLRHAVRRKVREETGLLVKDTQALGYFELLNGINPLGLKNSYHAVSVVFAAKISSSSKIKLDDQSKAYKFSKRLPLGFCINKF